MNYCALWMSVWSVVGWAASPEPAKPHPLQSLLEHPIVGDTLPMAEVQRYCAARVPAMPKVTTVADWEAEAGRIRSAVLERVVFRGEGARWRDTPGRVEWLDTIPGGPGYHIRKVRYEALPGMWIPALLYEPEKLQGKVPVILNVNGHVGAPGKAIPYKQLRCINLAKRGMLALNVEWLGMGQLGTPGYSHARMNQLDLCGTSGVAPFYLSLKRGLDLLLSLEHADPNRVAVTGVSGGGWQSIVIGSLDTRVTLANPVAGYSSFRTRAEHLTDLGDSEQTPTDLATVADYTHLTALRAPRPTLLTKNSKDNCCFASAHALPPLLEAAQPIFALYGRKDALRWHINDDPGTHNYEIDNRQAFYRMVGDFFYPCASDYQRMEIPSEKEVKNKSELDVPLPNSNEDFNTLARKLCQPLPRDNKPPSDSAALAAWQESQRKRLAEVVKAKHFDVHAIPLENLEKDGVKASYWRFQMGGAWTVPGVELTSGSTKHTAILVADGGRTAVAVEAARLLTAGYRVLAIDPFYFGESKFPSRDYLWALLVAAVGDRPLGLQASQVAAVARWATSHYSDGPATVVAVGPRSSAFALITAAIEPQAVVRIELRRSLRSLKEVVERNWQVSEKPELFCFGLLERFDLPQITALVTPRPVILLDE